MGVVYPHQLAFEITGIMNAHEWLHGGQQVLLVHGGAIQCQEFPPGAGAIVSADWDFTGSGEFPFSHEGITGTDSALTLTTNHRYDRPGEYFVTGRVHSHRNGDVNAKACRIANVAQARVIVS